MGNFISYELLPIVFNMSVTASVASLLRLRERLEGAVLLRDNVYLADYIVSPFVMGIFHPKIYLPLKYVQ